MFASSLGNENAVCVRYSHFDRMSAVQAVSRTGDSGVVGAHRHFDPVERLPGYFAVLYEVPRHTVHAHIDRRQVVGCADDQVRPGDEPVFISGIVVNERAARSFDATHSAARFWDNIASNLLVGYRRIFKKLDNLFAGIQKFDQARPVVEHR